MKKAILSTSLILAAFAFVLQLPMSDIAMRAQGQLAAVLSPSDYGTKLGQTVHEVVLSIHKADEHYGRPKLITHAHVMAVMCQENPKLNIAVNNGQGFSRGNQEGLTQVIDATAKRLLNGKAASGRCTYINQLEKGICSDIRARVSNPRCSIELGSCYFNEKLQQAGGDSMRAYVGYNTGSVKSSPSKANGLTDFVRGYNAIAKGGLCAKARSNISVWKAMWQRIAELTNGQFKTDGAEHIMTSTAGWPTSPDSIPTVKNIGNTWWKSITGQQVAQSQTQPQSSTSTQQPTTAQQSAQSPLGQSNASWLDRLLGNTSNTTTTTVTPVATLTCGAVASKVQLRWSCPSGTTVSRGFGTLGASFDTHGAGAGAVSSDPVSGAEYIVQCIKEHQLLAEAKCTAPIVESVDDDPEVGGSTTLPDVQDSIPDGVVMHIDYERINNTSSIIWATLGTRECQLTAGALRKLGTSGSLPIDEPTQDILIKLECNTVHGKAVKYKKIVVE